MRSADVYTDVCKVIMRYHFKILLYFVSRNPNRVVNWFPIIFKINSDAVKSTFYTMFANDQWPSFT